MAAIPVGFPSRASGYDLSTVSWTTASAGGDTFPPGGNNWLRVRSTSTAVCTVTVMVAADNPGLAGAYYAPLTILPALAANNADRVYGPFPSNPFASQADGQVHVSYTTSTGVQVQVINFGSA